MSEETQAREAICEAGLSLFSRGLTFGSTGNISVRLPDGGWLMTPTNASLGKLDPATLSKFDAEGRLVSGGKPTKEAFLHFCMYGQRADARAVVHLHSTHSVAVSLLADVDPRDALPPLTAYFVMRVGRLPLAPYFPPGDETLGESGRGAWPASTMPCCSPITGRSSPALRSRTPSTRPRSSRRRPSSSSCCAARRSGRSLRPRSRTCGRGTICGRASRRACPH